MGATMTCDCGGSVRQAYEATAEKFTLRCGGCGAYGEGRTSAEAWKWFAVDVDRKLKKNNGGGQ
jgi:hypothetical protein